jgi:DNA repair protein SbcC/Rad50
MIIKKIKIKNIRSYEDAELDFPLGSMLFAGDIGSGKSSVLYALEFVLFGLQPGFMSGSSILKKGKDEGFVEAELELEGKQIKIKRCLEKKKNSIGQGKDCYIEIEGQKQKLSPEDLKARVLQLLNYPQSMLKSRTNLLYRFTIYTPQEEMKQILLEKPEERINTLRKIFGIDKYKNVLLNIDIISSKIKEKIKINEVKVLDLEPKKQEKASYEIKKQEEESKIKEILPPLQVLETEIKESKSNIQDLTKKIKKSHEIRTEIISSKINLKNLEEQKQKNMKEIERIDKSLQETFNISFQQQDFKQEILALNKEIESSDQKTRKFFEEIAVHASKKQEMCELEKRIHDLIECPYCKQQVSLDHKARILEEAKKNIENCDKNIQILKQERDKLEKESQELKNKIEQVRNKERESETIKLKLAWIADQKKVRDNLFQELRNFVEKQFSLEDKLKILEQDFSNFQELEASYETESKILETKSQQERELAIKKAQHEKQIQYYNSRISELQEEIKIKEAIALETSYLKKLNEWLSEHLTELISAIEKNVMLAINLEFNKMFEKWFSMLTENLNARINEDFTPIIEQQGFEIEYDALSGGERTAAALAYRLALNQIINNLMSKLTTRGLLILDEPTDGFSSEQLEKMRNILDELKTEQLILVSHESKIENFVQHVIKFEKKDGKSLIL